MVIGHLEHGVNATGNTKQGHQLVQTEEVELGGNKVNLYGQMLFPRSTYTGHPNVNVKEILQ